MQSSTYSSHLVFTLLKDLRHALVFVGGSEFVLQSRLAGPVEDTLGAVPEWDVSELSPVNDARL